MHGQKYIKLAFLLNNFFFEKDLVKTREIAINPKS